jgi:hypothetical protein
MINWYMNLTTKQYWRTFQIGSVVLALGSLMLVFSNYISLMEFLLIAFLPRTFFKFLRFKMDSRHQLIIVLKHAEILINDEYLQGSSYDSYQSGGLWV